MLFRQQLTFLLALLPCVLAFYPLVPAYRCIDYGQCASEVKRSDDELGFVTLKLKQNIPEVSRSDIKYISVLTSNLGCHTRVKASFCNQESYSKV